MVRFSLLLILMLAMNTLSAQNNPSVVKALQQHVYMLAEEIGERNVFRPDALHAAQRYIQQTWQAMGYDVQTQVYDINAVPSANLEVTVPGTVKANEIILLGAHYDSVHGSPGANDNGSGVAALLEISRLLLAAKPKRTLRFVAFVNEEPPFFYSDNMGSMHYAKAARQRGDDIRLMLSLETIGYYRDEPNSQKYPPLFRYFFPGTGNFIAFVSDFGTRSQQKKLVSAFKACSDFPVEHVSTFSWVPGVDWSDHLSFWRSDYPALMVTDTALYRYPYYHSVEDTADKLDYSRLADVTAGLACAVSRLADEGL